MEVTEGELREVVKDGELVKHNSRDVANYGWVVEEDGLAFHPCSVRICHAGLIYQTPVAPIVAVASQVMDGEYRRGRLAPPLQHRYYDWLLNRSPFSDVFISSDSKQVLDDEFLLLGCQHPRNVVVAACIAHRYLWEETKVVPVWASLVDAGMDEDGAFVLAHTISIPYNYVNNLEDVLASLCIEGQNSNHTVFGGLLYKTCLTNFRAHKMSQINKEPYTKTKSKHLAESVQEIFITKTLSYTACVEFVFKVVREFLGAPVQSNPNPFNRRRITNKYKYKDVIEAYVKAYPAILAEDAA